MQEIQLLTALRSFVVVVLLGFVCRRFVCDELLARQDFTFPVSPTDMSERAPQASCSFSIETMSLSF